MYGIPIFSGFLVQQNNRGCAIIYTTMNWLIYMYFLVSLSYHWVMILCYASWWLYYTWGDNFSIFRVQDLGMTRSLLFLHVIFWLLLSYYWVATLCSSSWWILSYFGCNFSFLFLFEVLEQLGKEKQVTLELLVTERLGLPKGCHKGDSRTNKRSTSTKSKSKKENVCSIFFSMNILILVADIVWGR